MQTNSPLVSVIVPVYNGERYLAETLESLRAQTHRPLEVIVVDDGSADGSAGIAERFAPLVRLVRQPHAGVSAAHNRGITQARGEFLSFLDADDLWPEDKTARQIAALADRPELDMVYGQMQQFVSPELDPGLMSRKGCSDQVVPGYSKGTLLMRRESFLRVGLFDTSRRLGEFIDWYLRALDIGLRGHMLPQVLLERRIHETNTGTRERDARTDYARILKASLDRRRQGATPNG